ncbi:hypothetical protein V5O48_018366 [Marasmius crinis-equi]|uniref:Uncharacterized protein n=1 Tax=Marasmius crinis-equi TaxID=585013 RepID=A0ABR3ELE2_9AGAR
MRSPANRHGVPAAHRHRYQFTFIELVCMPGFYRGYVASNPLPSTVPTMERYPQYDANVNVGDLAKFFRNQSVSVEAVEDAALWAINWLKDVNYSDEDSRFSVLELRKRIYDAIIPCGIPAGYDEDRYYPNGHIAKYPSSTIHDIPGASEFNYAPAAGLPALTSAPPAAVATANEPEPSNSSSAPTAEIAGISDTGMVDGTQLSEDHVSRSDEVTTEPRGD